MTPTITGTTDDYYHVRYNDPDEFDDIRTPDRADNPASSVAEGAEVRTGHEEGDSDPDWEIQSVLVPTDAAANELEAAEQADQFVNTIKS